MSHPDNIELGGRWFSIRELSRALGCCRQTISVWLTEGVEGIGRLEGVRVGRIWRISESAVKDFLRRAREARIAHEYNVLEWQEIARQVGYTPAEFQQAAERLNVTPEQLGTAFEGEGWKLGREVDA